MGTKTKADYAKQIAFIERTIAQDQSKLGSCPPHMKEVYKSIIARKKAEIRALKAEMKTAPKG